MSWITPICDRTQADVLYAMANQNSTNNLKGAWNVSDVNRIISNIEYLQPILELYYYNPSITNISDFNEIDLPYVSKLNIIRSNIINIVNSFHRLNNPSIRYGTIFDYNDANALEENLRITNQLLESMIKGFKISGTFHSGQNIIL